MSEVLLWSLSVYGMTIIVNRGQIYEGLRARFPKPEGETPFFGTLLRCTLCFGWWSGAFTHSVGFRVIRLDSVWPLLLLGEWPRVLLATFFSGCAGAGAAWILFLACEKLGQSNFLDSD